MLQLQFNMFLFRPTSTYFTSCSGIVYAFIVSGERGREGLKGESGYPGSTGVNGIKGGPGDLGQEGPAGTGLGT